MQMNTTVEYIQQEGDWAFRIGNTTMAILFWKIISFEWRLNQCDVNHLKLQINDKFTLLLDIHFGRQMWKQDCSFYTDSVYR